MSLNRKGGMAPKRDEHRKPVIRAFVALPGETLVEVAARRLPGGGFCAARPFISLDTLVMSTSTLHIWEKVVLGVIAGASFAAGYQNGGIVDGVMALAINTLIFFGLFKVGNKLFAKKESHG